MPTLYEVGKPYSPTRSSWPDGVDYNYRAGEHELRIFMRDPSPAEIAAVRRGKARFALTTFGVVNPHDLIVLCYKFGGQPWGDGSYNFHLVPADERIPPPARQPGGQDRALLNVILVDGATGLIRGLRAVSFSPEFTRVLEDAIRSQAERPFVGDEAYDDVIARMYTAYGSDDFAAMAGIHCVGGA